MPFSSRLVGTLEEVRRDVNHRVGERMGTYLPDYLKALNSVVGEYDKGNYLISSDLETHIGDYPGIIMLPLLGWLQPYDYQEDGLAYDLTPEARQVHKNLTGDGYTFEP